MTTLSDFDREPNFERLARRKQNFRVMIEHCLKFREKNKTCVIIETGCAWQPDNWEGHGQSTLIWDWLAKKVDDIFAISIDITPSSIENAKKHTTRVEFILGNSFTTLNQMSDYDKVGLMYLDSYDWSPEKNLESAYHHMAELAACWRRLPSGCMVVVDDRHGNYKGKHWMVEGFMNSLGLKPVFRNHQIGWIKDIPF